MTLERNSTVSQNVVFELCGGISQSHSPRLKIFQDGVQNAAPIFPSNNAVPTRRLRKPRQGVAASIWDTDRSECKNLVVRLWPSHFRNVENNVSVVVNLPIVGGAHSLSDKHRIDFLFINGTQPGAGKLLLYIANPTERAD